MELLSIVIQKLFTICEALVSFHSSPSTWAIPSSTAAGERKASLIPSDHFLLSINNHQRWS
ncbi:hypothetical protein F441_10128 [Phytophthora nicotianae CJ01A1]|uniref:Uncharacterized protein n=6 Tax=Phytophthora nicotianae TaxID=4792 RepID=W2PA33_PHYN3|nr:hypothetical protein PPTG_20272 [Phytophthora nicotianae INRA-310]ETI45211.1 hypothetical protein F443_10187 [Phytophthora nicotianae P1569]ETK85177.1 hypothetical protein L915_09966 [Phytophthora nicotianae]ETO73803.1 hypothetical protein F444_10284 [Phytophthora nicotianae P1976]ETP15020.1 hypothetical protein F441_10128 [Phytophthora nicotianae CJ01A1]ETP43048.1 hypothetical protein F442_10092 [Phytophthora nicotianae P10297]